MCKSKARPFTLPEVNAVASHQFWGQAKGGSGDRRLVERNRLSSRHLRGRETAFQSQRFRNLATASVRVRTWSFSYMRLM